MPEKDNTFIETEVLSNLSISRTSRILRLKRNDDFTAGQVVSVITNDTKDERIYSIASGEQNASIDILYKIIPHGKITPQLHKLVKNDRILVSKPYGSFIPASENAFLIATGTGIAPFYSMLISGYFKKVTVLHGSREIDDFYFSEYFNKQLGKSYIPCYTGKSETSIFKGRVSDYLNDIALPHSDYKYYLCGSAEMVVDTRNILINKGVSFQDICSEIYF